MLNRLLWTTALALALGTAACGDDDDALTFADLDQSEQVSNFTVDEYAAFCEWIVDTNTMSLDDPFIYLSGVDDCVELDRPDCELSLFVECAETEDASSTACLNYRSCAAPTYPPDNAKPCTSNPTECPGDGLPRACNHYRYTNGAWVVTPLEPVNLCERELFNYPCLCELKNSASLSCPYDSDEFSVKSSEGNCTWNPIPGL